MSDIHIRRDLDGIRLWKTVRASNGARIRVQGVSIKLERKEDIVESLPIFQPIGLVSQSLGESNVN